MATVTTGKQVTYDLIASITSTGGPLSFTSIPQTYQSLIIHAFPVLTSAPNGGGQIEFNGDTALNYFGNSWSASNYMSFSYSFNSNSTSKPGIGFLNGSGNGGIYTISDYTNTNSEKSVTTAGGSANGFNRGGYFWGGKTAITTITFSATNHTTGTVIHLYGLKKV